jgi:hypothetical protein
VQARVDIGPEAPLVKHTHPGEGILYILEGSLASTDHSLQITRRDPGCWRRGPNRSKDTRRLVEPSEALIWI